mmetsp:Transcript_75030/g.175967  ORF Transcript_75030/g.175967 Transcript_75030/m.175967 type:complete len:329 (+) Transcript_75030:1672-2658(+)
MHCVAWRSLYHKHVIDFMWRLPTQLERHQGIVHTIIDGIYERVRECTDVSEHSHAVKVELFISSCFCLWEHSTYPSRCRTRHDWHYSGCRRNSRNWSLDVRCHAPFGNAGRHRVEHVVNGDACLNTVVHHHLHDNNLLVSAVHNDGAVNSVTEPSICEIIRLAVHVGLHGHQLRTSGRGKADHCRREGARALAGQAGHQVHVDPARENGWILTHHGIDEFWDDLVARYHSGSLNSPVCIHLAHLEKVDDRRLWWILHLDHEANRTLSWDGLIHKMPVYSVGTAAWYCLRHCTIQEDVLGATAITRFAEHVGHRGYNLKAVSNGDNVWE